MVKQRAERMAQIVRRVVSSELIKLIPQAHILVTNTEVSDDLRYATVWVSSFSQPPRPMENVLSDVESHKDELQKAVASQITSRFTPALRFRADEGKAHADHVDKLLGDIS